jgi:small subunit ribosomal protein S20
LANIKSAMKRARQNEKRYMRNRPYVAGTRTRIRRARALIEKGELEQAAAAVQEAAQSLDKAAQKGVIHKNNASRRKSRLFKMLHNAQAKSA